MLANYQIAGERKNMATTKINTGKVIDASVKASSAHNTTANVGIAVSSIRRRVDGSILARNGVAGSFTAAQNAISELARDIAKIYQMANGAAGQYESTENSILNEGKRMGLIVAVPDTNAQTSGNKAQYEALFDKGQLHLIQSGMSVEEYLEEIGQKPEGKTDEGGQKNAIETFIDDFVGNCKDNARDSAIESSGNTAATLIGSYWNTSTALATGPTGTNSFVILDPQVASKSAQLINNTAAFTKVGVPIMGGVIDFARMKNAGENTGDALMKATVHVGIGIVAGEAGKLVGAKAGAAIGSLICPGVGTVVGGVVGFVAGAAIATIGNSIFDAVYDNRDEIKETVTEKWNDAKENIKEVGNILKEWGTNIGDAWSSGWSSLGNVFG